MYFNIITAVIGVFAGWSAFVVFFFHFENQQAGVWAFVSGMNCCRINVLFVCLFVVWDLVLKPGAGTAKLFSAINRLYVEK